ncbi:MAG: NfeD family protein [Succiniclasticum sp.]|jgi:membrane-bound serine protease (ClpP class)|nr:NfeD family protein [Succiniclasticum sp.]MEE3479302.1 NfeD family protein [Succiniclasticum sp.]
METIGLAVAGFILLGIEAMIPGFGVFGVAGILCLTASAFFLLGAGVTAAAVIAAVYVVVLLVIAFLAWYLPRDSKYNPFVLWDRQKSSGSNTLSREVKEYTGRTGKALTPLRPAGIAEIDGKRIDVQTQGEFIEPGTVVVVLRTEGSKVLVEAAADKAK